MDYRAFEQRLLETIFTTDVPLTPATIAFLYKLPVQEAADLLQQAAVHGLLNIESDDEGNLLYTYPNRTRLRREGGQPSQTSQPEQTPNALVRAEPTALTPTTPPLLLTAEPLPGEAAPAQPTPTTRCPFCGETILVTAKKCRHCHEYLDYALRDLQSIRGPGHAHPVHHPAPASSQALVPWNGLQPALLSFFMPGLGQICTGRVPSGLLWMMFTIIGYIPLVIPGIILHILCIINASKQPRQIP